MFDIAEKKLGVELDRDFKPRVNLTPEELKEAKNFVIKVSKDKMPVVWIQTKTGKKEKE